MRSPQLTPQDILGTTDSSKDSVERCYKNLCRFYHPDNTVTWLPRNLQSEADQVFFRIHDAYLVLKGEKASQEFSLQDDEKFLTNKEALSKAFKAYLQPVRNPEFQALEQEIAKQRTVIFNQQVEIERLRAELAKANTVQGASKSESKTSQQNSKAPATQPATVAVGATSKKSSVKSTSSSLRETELFPAKSQSNRMKGLTSAIFHYGYQDGSHGFLLMYTNRSISFNYHSLQFESPQDLDTFIEQVSSLPLDLHPDGSSSGLRIYGRFENLLIGEATKYIPELSPLLVSYLLEKNFYIGRRQKKILGAYSQFAILPKRFKVEGLEKIFLSLIERGREKLLSLGSVNLVFKSDSCGEKFQKTFAELNQALLNDARFFPVKLALREGSVDLPKGSCIFAIRPIPNSQFDSFIKEHELAKASLSSFALTQWFDLHNVKRSFYFKKEHRFLDFDEALSPLAAPANTRRQ